MGDEGQISLVNGSGKARKVELKMEVVSLWGRKGCP